MSVYKAINAVQAALSKIGITKDGRNTQGAGYNFRGIDQVYNTLSPLLSEHGLCILPRVVKSEQTERTSSKGGVLIYSYVTMEFDLVCAEDGSKHTICTVGEAFDSGDKSMNKAMSAAYKYAAFQAFAIPTEGDNDADAHTHEVAPRKAPVIPARPAIVLDDDTEAFLQELAMECMGLVKQGNATAADEKIRAQKLDGDQEIALANMMDSASRGAIKAARKAWNDLGFIPID
jgi:hypothetical protein